jgi:tripartite-type tricarboxylate transporter receptor subunit TctC
MPDVQKRLADQGDQSAELTPAQLAAFLREERERWGTLIKDLGLQVQ